MEEWGENGMDGGSCCREGERIVVSKSGRPGFFICFEVFSLLIQHHIVLLSDITVCSFSVSTRIQVFDLFGPNSIPVQDNAAFPTPSSHITDQAKMIRGA